MGSNSRSLTLLTDPPNHVNHVARPPTIWGYNMMSRELRNAMSTDRPRREHVADTKSLRDMSAQELGERDYQRALVDEHNAKVDDAISTRQLKILANLVNFTNRTKAWPHVIADCTEEEWQHLVAMLNI